MANGSKTLHNTEWSITALVQVFICLRSIKARGGGEEGTGVKWLMDRPLFLSGGYLFRKKELFASCSWLKNCLLQGYEEKKLSAKRREFFF